MKQYGDEERCEMKSEMKGVYKCIKTNLQRTKSWEESSFGDGLMAGESKFKSNQICHYLINLRCAKIFRIPKKVETIHFFLLKSQKSLFYLPIWRKTDIYSITIRSIGIDYVLENWKAR